MNSDILRRSTREGAGILPSPRTGPVAMGYLRNIIESRSPEKIKPDSGSYKYVIVMLGLQVGHATADRLAGLLAHSGSVILLQESRFSCHFSPFLHPWVHYVPISYSLADLARKIEWLQRNDKLARRIASNARAFGRSYLWKR